MKIGFYNTGLAVIVPIFCLLGTTANAGRCSDAEEQYSMEVSVAQQKMSSLSGAKAQCQITVEMLQAGIKFLNTCREADPNGEQMRAFEKSLAGAVRCVNSF